MSSSSTIKVSNISSSSSEKEIRDFLSFCGKISSLTLSDASDGTKNATVVFEKESASRTALLLDRTSLGSNEIHVSSASDASSTSTTTSSAQHDENDGELKQEDKPRTRIFAEYLAHGYKIGDSVLQKGIEIDSQHGISSKFTKALQDFDKKTGATTRAAAVDQKYSISDKATKSAQGAYASLSSYFEKFVGTPTGQRVHKFYQDGNKQVTDIHQEALRLAGLNKSATDEHTPHAVGTDEKGNTQTKCECAGSSGTCGCKPGECACNGCAKANSEKSSATTTGEQTATGAADQIAANTGVDPLASQKQ